VSLPAFQPPNSPARSSPSALPDSTTPAQRELERFLQALFSKRSSRLHLVLQLVLKLVLLCRRLGVSSTAQLQLLNCNSTLSTTRRVLNRSLCRRLGVYSTAPLLDNSASLQPLHCNCFVGERTRPFIAPGLRSFTFDPSPLAGSAPFAIKRGRVRNHRLHADVFGITGFTRLW